MLNAALELSGNHGFRLLPVSNPHSGGPAAGKKPLIRGWQKSATTNADQIRAWLSQWPHANLGIATGAESGIIVLDVDPKNGGLKSFARLEQAIELPPTLTVKTGSGGYHYYFQYPVGMTIGNTAGGLGPGLDIRAEGGFVVAPPSLHACGQKYEWANNLPIADAPQLMERLKRMSSKRPQTTSTQIIQPGNRNTALTSIAGRLRRNGADLEQIENALENVNHGLEQPLGSDEVHRIATSVSRYDPALDLTEEGVAKMFAELFSDSLRYSPYHGWLVFDGKAWRQDLQGLIVQEAVKKLLSELHQWIDTNMELTSEMRVSLGKQVRTLRRHGPIHNIAKLARSAPKVVDREDWSECSFLVNFQNGTFDLRSMKLRDHDPADRLRVVLPYPYDASMKAPNFSKALSDALDEESARFLLRLYGYALSGKGGGQKLTIFVGAGKNGKSTIAEAVRHALGEYAKTANPETFMKSNNKPAINNDVADLAGARLVTTSELSADQRLDAPLVKRMTGGEQMKARFLHQEYFTFNFNALLVMVSNFSPLFDASDTGIARRLLFLPFDRIIADDAVDEDLPMKLREEAPGIMNLLLQGYADYLDRGFDPPASVMQKTSEVLKDHNQVARFVDDRCDLTGSVMARSLFQDYEVWCVMERTRPMSERAFKNSVERTFGLTQKRAAAGQRWVGITLKPQSR
jgi:putative DNA primase/helicase